MNKKIVKKVVLGIVGLSCLTLGTAALAVLSSGIGGVAAQATRSLSSVAQLITAASYTAGLAFAVGAIVKFKAHKDNPTQVPIGMPIALLFIGAALIFMPSVFLTAGSTLFGGSGYVAGASGIADFGGKKPK